MTEPEQVARWEVRACSQGHIVSGTSGICWCGYSLREPFEVVRAQGARTRDPSTSKNAAVKVAPRVGSQREKCLRAIRNAGSAGLTAHEVERVTGIGGAWRRVSELRQGGFIKASGTRKDPVTDTEGEVYVIATD